MLNMYRLFLFITLFISPGVFSQGVETMMKQKFNQTLYNQLPTSVKDAKQIIAVDYGHAPPYLIYNESGDVQGLAIDLFTAISQILGVELQYNEVSGIPAILLGLQSGRYDLAIGPITDLPDRRVNNDFIAYSASFLAITTQKGNPHNIHSSTDMCGKQMAAVSGHQGVDLLTKYSNECVTQGKTPITISEFKDQPTALLAVKSERADAVLGGVSILSYYVANSKDTLELVTLDNTPIRYHSAVVAKGSPLGPIILAALQELYANGTYAEIMKKWNMEAAMLPEAGINLAK